LKKNKKLSKSEFYNILDSILPDGDRVKSKGSIYFTRINLEGLDEMHSYSTDKRLYEFLEYKPFTSVDETKNYLQNLINIESNNNPSAICWFIRRVSDDRMIGTARLVEINFKRKSVVWGYGIDPRLWGEGYIFEIQELLKEYIFEKLKLNRLYGITMVENERVISSLKAAGCKNEGISRDYYCDSDDKFHDAWNYSILAKDYWTKKQLVENKNSKECITKKDIAIIITKELNDDSVDENSDMGSISNWDSLSHISVILAIEKETGLSLSPKEIAQATSVKSIYNIVNNLK